MTIALEVSSAAGRPPFGGVGGAIRGLVTALLRLDPETRYLLCTRLSRRRKGELFDPGAPNAHLRWIQDPLNDLLLRRVRLFHAMGVFVPHTPRVVKAVTIHDLNPIRNPEWVTRRWREKRGAKIRDAALRADHVVTYSAFTAGEVCEEWGLPDSRVHPVPLGVDAAEFGPLAPGRLEPLRRRFGDYALAVGLLTPRKNFERLVAAVSRLEGLRLVVVGRPSNGAESFWRAVREAKLEERVTHLDSVSHEDLVGLLNAARVVAVPSLYEGFGLTPLEAMACGAPVVCSRAASLPEVVGDAALLVDATDVDAMAHAIDRVLRDPELAEDLRSRGLSRARQASWEASARRLRAVYERIAA